MAAESWVARFVRAITAGAVSMHRPARRAYGSVRAAVAICAFVLGMYDFVIRFHYQDNQFDFYGIEFRYMKYIAASTAYASSLSDVVLVFGVFQGDERTLQYVVCAVLALFTFCALIPLIIIILLACSRQWISMLWELPRVLLYPFHFLLMVCLLAELRGQIPDAPPVADGVDNSTAGEGHHLLKDEEKGDSNEASKPPTAPASVES